ncbi:26624_t:CDS:2 [Racocetra persica]|uniref:26624_t:CDS:1 n=2 Tax=Racocetra persica TaxID=160502 RepID=A0ACA9MG75_9GLOM|nr:26623_t:CDS:2 [Racocetra persica]CAG8587549.1 26624_t:CDS:2 [Racocetra persica]
MSSAQSDHKKESLKTDEAVSLKTVLQTLLTAVGSHFTVDIKFLSINIQIDPIVEVDDANVRLEFKSIEVDDKKPGEVKKLDNGEQGNCIDQPEEQGHCNGEQEDTNK